MIIRILNSDGFILTSEFVHFCVTPYTLYIIRSNRHNFAVNSHICMIMIK